MIELTPGFCAPILWGTKRGYSVATIAAGLEINEALVIAVIEANSGVRFPRPPAPPIDASRDDAAYRAWAHQQRGAAHTLDLLEVGLA